MSGFHLLLHMATLASVDVDTSTMKSFGHSIKNGHLIANTEINLFEHVSIYKLSWKKIYIYIYTYKKVQSVCDAFYSRKAAPFKQRLAY